MPPCQDVSPRRRVTSSEERELLVAATRLKDAENEAEVRRAQRDQLIADLLDANARLPDIAEILRLTPKAIRDARDRARER
jgi:hypothetical protein